MSISNEVVNLIPASIDDLVLTPISKRYRIINIAITLLISTTLLCIALILDLEVVISEPVWFNDFKLLFYSVIGLYALWSSLYHFFADPLIKYSVREQDMHFQSGLFFRKLISQPILRIQHIELKRGPIERKANLASLQVFSAGGVSHTFEIPGLEYENAIALRKFIINHKDLSLDE